VMYYGAPPDEEGVKKITCPVACFVGKKDGHIMGAMPAFAAAMKKHGKSYEEHFYENAEHAFSNDRRPSYDVDATRDAYAKTLAFFQTNLV
ncbi:MAG TPA: dienelactone hydrolase family protein, partial [Polyangiaceae bacterium]